MNSYEPVRWQVDLDQLVAAVKEHFRVLAGGFPVEIALAWPLIGEKLAVR